MPGIDVHIRDKIDASIVQKLRQQGTAANSTARAIERLNTAMASMSRTTGMGPAVSSITNFGTASEKARRSFGGFMSDLSTAEGRFNALSSSVMEGVRGLRSLLGAIFVVSLNLGAIERLDTFKSMQNQLRLTTTSTEQLNSVTAQLFGIAERARVPVESLVRSFRRFDSAMAKMGKSQGDSLRMTETVGKMLTLAGANANESASALLQLSQAFNKGKLDGDEFRSVAELMPQVLDAMAKHLDRNRGELFKLSRQGKLTANDLSESILKVSEEVDAAMAGMPRTIGNAVTSLMNNILLEFGKFDMASNVTDRIVDGFDAIKNNLPAVVDGLQGVAAALFLLATPSIFHFFTTASKFFLNIPGMVAVGVGLFAAFADKIKVSGSETATLSDRMVALFDLFKEDITAPQMDGISKLQAAWDFIASNLEFVIKEWGTFMSDIAAFAATIEQVGLSGWAEALADGMQYVAKIIDNGIIDGLIRMAEIGDKAITALGRTFDAVILGPFNAFLNKMGDFVSQFDKSIASVPVKAMLPEGYLSDLSAELKKGLHTDAGIDTGFIEYLKSLKVEMGDTGKKWEAMNKQFDDIQAETTKSMDDRYANFLKALEERTEQNAAARIATEQKVADAFTEKPELNRPADLDLQRHQQILDYKNAVEKAAESHALLNQAIQADGPFSEGFVRKLIEKRTALQGFKSELDLSKIALSELIEGWEDDPKFAEPIKQAEEAIRKLQEAMTVPTEAPIISPEAVQGTSDAIQNMDATINNATSSIDNMGGSFTLATQEASSFEGDASSSLVSVGSAADSAGGSIDSSLASAFQSGTFAVNDFADNAISRLNEVAQAASSISFGGGGGLMGFARGGYTGNLPENRIAGVVHGQEYVMPADATRQYRPLLDAMRSGSLGTGGGTSAPAATGGAMKVSVHNYGSSKISVQQISQDEIRIIAREEAERSVQTHSGEVVAAHLRNPNSKVSRSISAHTNAQRRR